MKYNQKLTEEDRDKLCSIYEQGVGAIKLSRKFNISFMTVYQTLRKRGVEVRSNTTFVTESSHRWKKTATRNNFGRALERILTRHGTSTREVAPRLGITFQGLFKKVWGKASSYAFPHFIYKIADELELDDNEIEELFEAIAADGYRLTNSQRKYKYTRFGHALKQMLWERGLTQGELKILTQKNYSLTKQTTAKHVDAAAYALELSDVEYEKLIKARERDLMND